MPFLWVPRPEVGSRASYLPPVLGIVGTGDLPVHRNPLSQLRVPCSERLEQSVNDDGALVQRCLAGDADAARTFVERYRGLVFSLCWRMLRHREDAEDVAQETFVRVFRHLDHWEPSRPLRPWLMAIAANRCRTRLSRRKGVPASAGEWQDFAVEHDHPLDLAEELQQGIELLRDDHRLCFVMFYQQELSVQEIAAALDSPEGTIKTWLHRARKQLAEYLLQRGVVDQDGYELHRT
ncbi:MAG: hypothetical protein B7Z55_01795 [Planctomycetales bacterium 12-60-4]|nr:MAG: hypothetical protein B7Z55_01795 [Planctomycetales bacterium 12-60-4]